MFISISQAIEIFILPAVPTEHLDAHRQPHFPLTPNSVPQNNSYIYFKILQEEKALNLIMRKKNKLQNNLLCLKSFMYLVFTWRTQIQSISY